MYNHNRIIEKLVKLKERIALSEFSPQYEDDKDMNWCGRLLSDVRDGGLVPNKEEFMMANTLWKKYNGGVDTNSEAMWVVIDDSLKQHNKIGAIKLYRRFTGSSLREAKDIVDAREQKIKRGW